MKPEIKQIHAAAKRECFCVSVSGFTLQYSIIIPGSYFFYCGCLNVNSCFAAVTNSVDAPYMRSIFPVPSPPTHSLNRA